MGIFGRIIHSLPGKRFGVVRLYPFFFCFGAALEFSMIKWKPNGVNFYEVYKRKELESLDDNEVLSIPAANDSVKHSMKKE